MVPIDISYLGGLRCKAVHGPSGQSIITDAPTDNHGKGEFFSPTDLVAAALGSCVATVMGIVAERDGIDLTGMCIHVEKEMAAQPLRRLGRVTIRLMMPAGLTKEQQHKLELTAASCPVVKSLSEQVEVPIEFLWPNA